MEVQAKREHLLQREVLAVGVEGLVDLIQQLLPMAIPHGGVLEVLDQRHGGTELVHLLSEGAPHAPALDLPHLAHRLVELQGLRLHVIHHQLPEPPVLP